MEKIRVGIIFGGQSREREVSFAGGRTVYDNLNKSIFEPVPLFVDSFNNFTELRWEFVYKGTIRDFYPPVEFLPAESEFQLYAENIEKLTADDKKRMQQQIGTPVSVDALASKIDFAFLCLHGPFGEDGSIQGLLEFLHIPYSGSGILASATGIDKSIQKAQMIARGFNSPAYTTIDRSSWIEGRCKGIFKKVREEVGFPCVIKPSCQGSSIGVTILKEENEHDFMSAVEKALFTKWMDAGEWNVMDAAQKTACVRQLADIREGLGLPVVISYPESLGNPVISNPSDLIRYLDANLKEDGFILESVDGENTVLVESFIDGREFSCIVVEDENGAGLALPPTEIRKGKELFDYRSKYLPGLSRKITPIDLPENQITQIREACEKLFAQLHFDVYARIDGFAANDGKIYLNDPNTTSGMMPSSFFFHQAAEIGLNPSQFLTYIIRTSLNRRLKRTGINPRFMSLLNRLDVMITADQNAAGSRKRVAVILGGYSSERHISVESGRNVFEKLASSGKYFPFPVFLTGNNKNHTLYKIPVNLLLKDNADDIREKAESYKVHPVIKNIIQRAENITRIYAGAQYISEPERISYKKLKEYADEVFIALHGRPGEDGAIQVELEKIGLPYNGSGKESSSLTINKYRTNEILKAHGFLVAGHMMVTKEYWQADQEGVLKEIAATIKYPFIAKPVDDGCSSAVRKIRTPEEFGHFCKLMFRTEENLDPQSAAALHIKPKEEFPLKEEILVEELISSRGAAKFLEVTGGMLTHLSENGELIYEVFEASEALAEGEVLSLEEKFLAGQGQNITPARYSPDARERERISNQVRETLGAAAKVLGVTGYCRIDAFVRIYADKKVEVIFIEVNSLPGMTPATCIFHQAAINGYKPFEFIDRILEFGEKRQQAANV
jgi:UDP-N-acetylmuramate--alanine ligase